MKKFFALALALTMVFAMAACGGSNEDVNAKSEGVMTYAEYAAAELNAEVVVHGVLEGGQAVFGQLVIPQAAVSVIIARKMINLPPGQMGECQEHVDRQQHR